MLIRVLAGLLGKSLKQRGFDKPQTTEIEVVANTAYEIVDNGVGLARTFYDIVVIGIHHRCIGIDTHVQHAIEGTKTYLQLTWLCLQQYVVGFRLFGYLHHRVAAGKTVYTNLSAIRELRGCIF